MIVYMNIKFYVELYRGTALMKPRLGKVYYYS